MPDVYKRQLLGDELFGLFVVVGVDGVSAVLIIIALQIDRVTGRRVIIEAEIGEVARREALDDRVIECIGVEMDGRGAGGDGDGASVLVDLDDGVDAVGFDIARGLVDQGADVLGVEIQAGLQDVYKRQMQNPYVGLTAEVEARAILGACHRNGWPFLLTMVWCTGRAANAVPAAAACLP